MDNSRSLLIISRLCSSLKSAFSHTGAKKAVIGLSGGIDSSLAAAVAAEALGKDSVLLYYLPYKTSSSESFKDADALCKRFNMKMEVIDISNIADSFFSISSGITPLRKGNIMSRIRMTILFDRAKAYNGVVLGTSNKSERLLGYGTWYGDTASSINVLGELYKYDVRSLSSAIGIPETIINKAPTADLWEGQTDEKELGFTYDEADRFFYSAIELSMNREEIYKTFGEEFSRRISQKVIANSFKRSLPVICSVFSSDADKDNISEIFKKFI